jgi:pyruvate dehydrogenase E2 component (dihydrolipoamide acetyltransferase)
MSEAKATVPDFWVSADVDMGEVLELRARLKGAVGGEPVPSINDFVVRAAAVTLCRHPRLNGGYRDGAFELWERINVGVAVATEEGLVVPTVFDADQRPVSAIARDVRRLAERVRDGTVTPPELAGGTFTISNLGMHGVDSFAGIVNPPQAAILCVGRVSERPAVVDGAVVARPLATFTLVSDHRIVYGADAAAFLADLGAALADPLPALL